MKVKTKQPVTIYKFKPTWKCHTASFELPASEKVFLFVVESYTDHYTGGRYHIFEQALALCRLGHTVVWLSNCVPIYIKSFKEYEELKNLIVIVPKSGSPSPSIFTEDYIFKNIVGTPLTCIECVATYKFFHPSSIYYQVVFVVPPLAKQYRGGLDIVDSGIGWERLRDSLKKADIYWTQTELNKKWLVKWLSIPAHKIYIIPPAVNDKVADQYLNMPKKDQIIFISRFVTYKNPHHVLEVVKKLNYKGKVVMIGGAGGLAYDQFYKIAKENNINLQILECCDDYKKFQLIAESKLLLYPTTWEDFGMPPIEAAYYNIQTVTYPNPTFEEVYKNLLHYAERNNIISLTRITKNLLENPTPKDNLRNFVLSNFTFNCMVDNMYKMLQKPFDKKQPTILFDTVTNCTYRGIGDVLMTTPAIRALKVQFPNSIIHYYTHKHSCGVLSNNPYIDKVILNQRDLDDAYTLHLKLERKLEIDCPRNYLSRVDSILELFNLKTDDKKLVLNLTEQEKQKVKKYFINNNKLNIGITITTESPTRKWPYKRFLEVVDSLKENHNVYILDKKKENYFNKPGITNLTGMLSVREWCAVISQLDLLITIDSASLHIAGCFDVDTVCLFGATIPKLRAKYYDKCRSIIGNVGCRKKGGYCYLDPENFYHSSIGCLNAEQQQCMLLITSHQVLERIHRNKTLLKGPSRISKPRSVKHKKILIKLITGELGDKLVGMVLTGEIRRKYPNYEIDVYLFSERFNTLGGYDLLFQDCADNCYVDKEMIEGKKYDKIFEISAYGIHNEELDEAIKGYIPLSRYQRWARRMGIHFKGRVKPLYKVREEDGIRINNKMKFKDLKHPIICIAPVTSNKTKDWEQLKNGRSPKWQKVIDYLYGKGYSCITVHYESLKYNNCLNIGNVNPRELGYLISKSDLVIGTEAGCTHFAGILEIPMIVLVGSSSSLVLRHYKNVRVVRRGNCEDCSRFISPKFKKCECGSLDSNPESKCIVSVTPEEVIKEIELFEFEKGILHKNV